MHRVELKAGIVESLLSPRKLVPNAPCGVERVDKGRFAVPQNTLFLMHRVELKVSPSDATGTFKIVVPNAPCGVESIVSFKSVVSVQMFLMHRVELKDGHTLRLSLPLRSS